MIRNPTFIITCILHCALCIVHCELSSAQVAGYTDYQGRFQVFDKGIYQQLEYLPVKSFKVGGNSIAYVDNTSELQIYYGGKKYHQAYASNLTYYVTNNLVVYQIGLAATVFDKGQTTRLSYFVSQLYVNDSIVGYFDDSNYNLGVYYNGFNSVLESSLLQPPKAVKSGSNLLAYVNQSGYFKIFYHGQVTEVDIIPPISFAAGQDLVAYVDGYNRYFNLYYKGQTAQLDVNQPDSFKVGFGIMAYIDYEGNFRVFSNGATRRLLSNRPDFFEVYGNMIVYGNNSEFRAFYNGQSILISDVFPREYVLGIDGVAFLDTGGALKFFQKGKLYHVTTETVNKYFVNNDLVWYQVGVNTWKVFYNGQNY